MTDKDGAIWFLASCVEFYKEEKGISGQDAYNYFRESGALGFLVGCWEGLHMTGHLYIIDSIDDYIKNHVNKDN